MLDNESIRCFLAAMRHLNFRAAASEVFLSPAAFSDRIQRLEESLNVRLFQRSTRHIQPTAAALALFPKAEELLIAEQNCQQAVSETPKPYEFTIGTRYELGLSFIIPIIQSLRNSHPHWTIHIFFGDTPSLLGALSQGKIDAVFGSMRLSIPHLETRRTHVEKYSFVSSPKLLKSSPIKSISDLKNHTLLDVSSDLALFRYFLDSETLRSQPSISSQLYVGTIAAMLSYILNEFGIGVLPYYFVKPYLDSGECVEVLKQHKPQHDHFRLFWKSRHWATEALKELANIIESKPLE
jgi:LysR family transcriptional regulator, glycine cleavage system transcriptional activator